VTKYFLDLEDILQSTFNSSKFRRENRMTIRDTDGGSVGMNTGVNFMGVW